MNDSNNKEKFLQWIPDQVFKSLKKTENFEIRSEEHNIVEIKKEYKKFLSDVKGSILDDRENTFKKLLNKFEKEKDIPQTQLANIQNSLSEKISPKDRREIKFHSKIIFKEVIKELEKSDTYNDAFDLLSKKSYSALVYSFMLNQIDNKLVLPIGEKKLIKNYSTFCKHMFIYHYITYVYENLKSYWRYLDFLSDKKRFEKFSKEDLELVLERLLTINQIFNFFIKEVFDEFHTTFKKKHTWYARSGVWKKGEYFNLEGLLKDLHQDSLKFKKELEKIQKEDIKELISLVREAIDTKTPLGRLKKYREFFRFWTGK